MEIQIKAKCTIVGFAEDASKHAATFVRNGSPNNRIQHFHLTFLAGLVLSVLKLWVAVWDKSENPTS